MQYRFGKSLGKGGFAQVFQCMHLETKKQYAMKMIRKDHAAKDKQLQRLMEQELEILTDIDYPHIVRLVEMFEDDVNFYVVMELMEGGDLFNYMEKT